MTDPVHRALLIANWEFPRDPGQLPELNGPRRDLPLLRRALTDPRTGLHGRDAVTVLANRTRTVILRRLEDFFGEASREQQLLVYYSGHGRLNLEDQLYLCARDTDTSRLVSSAVSARDVSEMIASSPARAKIVILDCCYSGSFKSGSTHPRRLAGEGRFVLTSSRRAQLSRDAAGPDEPSPFTRVLAEALRGGARDSDGDGYISAEDVYHHVRERMRAESGATPQRSVDHAVGELALARTPVAGPARVRPAKPDRPAVVPDPTVRPAGGEPPPAGASRRTVPRPRARAATSRTPAGSVPTVAPAGSVPTVAPAGSASSVTSAGSMPSVTPAGSAPTVAPAGSMPSVTPAGSAPAPRVRPAAPGTGSGPAPAGGPVTAADPAALREGFAAARARERRGDVRGARLAYQRIIDTGPGDWPVVAAQHLARMLAGANDVAGATGAYRLVIADGHPEWSARAAGELGRLLADAGQVAAARDAYERAVDAGHPQWSPRAACELAELLAGQGEPGTARSLYQQAMDSGHPDWAPRAAVGLGGLLVQAGEIGAARAVYRRAVLSGHPEWAARARAPLRTLETAGPASVAGLVDLLGGGERGEIRERTDPVGWPPWGSLTDGLTEPRWRAAEALAVLGDQRAVAALVGVLATGDRGVRLSAARALGTRAAGAAVTPLLGLLGTDDPDLRWAAVDALAAIGPPAVPALVGALAAAPPTATGAVAALAAMPAAGLPELGQALRSGKRSVRLGAAEALGRRGPAALPPLLDAFQEGTATARDAAATGLVMIGAEAVDGLVDCLSAADPVLRAAAAGALGRITSRRALGALERMLADPEPGCRTAAAGALAAHGPEALPAVARALRDPRLPARLAAVEAAAGIGGEAVPELRHLTGGPPPANEAAVAALGRIRTPAAVFHLSEIGRLDAIRADQPSQT